MTDYGDDVRQIMDDLGQTLGELDQTAREASRRVQGLHLWAHQYLLDAQQQMVSHLNNMSQAMASMLPENAVAPVPASVHLVRFWCPRRWYELAGTIVQTSRQARLIPGYWVLALEDEPPLDPADDPVVELRLTPGLHPLLRCVLPARVWLWRGILYAEYGRFYRTR